MQEIGINLGKQSKIKENVFTGDEKGALHNKQNRKVCQFKTNRTKERAVLHEGIENVWPLKKPLPDDTRLFYQHPCATTMPRSQGTNTGFRSGISSVLDLRHYSVLPELLLLCITYCDYSSFKI